MKTAALSLGALVLLAACASGGGAGAAQDAAFRALLSGDALMFVSFDRDGDLATSTAESEAGILAEFERADTSGDGALQPIEFQNWALAVLGGAQMGPYRLDFDRNVDNVISREEFVTELTARAADYDVDRDGRLTRAEFVRPVGQTRPAR